MKERFWLFPKSNLSMCRSNVYANKILFLSIFLTRDFVTKVGIILLHLSEDNIMRMYVSFQILTILFGIVFEPSQGRWGGVGVQIVRYTVVIKELLIIYTVHDNMVALSQHMHAHYHLPARLFEVSVFSSARSCRFLRWWRRTPSRPPPAASAPRRPSGSSCTGPGQPPSAEMKAHK